MIVDRRFFARRTQLQQTIHDLGNAFADRSDLQAVVRNLVDKLPQLLGIEFAALYLLRDDVVERVAGPEDLPERLPVVEDVWEELSRQRGLTRLSSLRQLVIKSGLKPNTVDRLAAAGVELVGELATSRRQIGAVLLSEKTGQLSYDQYRTVFTPLPQWTSSGGGSGVGFGLVVQKSPLLQIFHQLRDGLLDGLVSDNDLVTVGLEGVHFADPSWRALRSEQRAVV